MNVTQHTKAASIHADWLAIHLHLSPASSYNAVKYDFATKGANTAYKNLKPLAQRQWLELHQRLEYGKIPQRMYLFWCKVNNVAPQTSNKTTFDDFRQWMRNWGTMALAVATTKRQFQKVTTKKPAEYALTVVDDVPQMYTDSINQKIDLMAVVTISMFAYAYEHLYNQHKNNFVSEDFFNRLYAQRVMMRYFWGLKE